MTEPNKPEDPKTEEKKDEKDPKLEDLSPDKDPAGGKRYPKYPKD